MAEANGFLITTAINSDTGEAGSETYKILEATGEGDQAAYSVRDDEGKLWTIIQRPVGIEDPRVEQYRQLLRIMIDNDARFPGQGESLADYAAGASPELLALIEREK
jgi:hypothetical protein